MKNLLREYVKLLVEVDDDWGEDEPKANLEIQVDLKDIKLGGKWGDEEYSPSSPESSTFEWVAEMFNKGTIPQFPGTDHYVYYKDSGVLSAYDQVRQIGEWTTALTDDDVATGHWEKW